MKKFQCIIFGWGIFILSLIWFYISCTAPVFGVLGFISTITWIVALVAAIWESVTWEKMETRKYVNGPYAFLLRHKKVDDLQSWSDYDNEFDIAQPAGVKPRRNKLKVFLWVGVIFLILAYLINISMGFVQNGAKIYNASKLYQNAYQQKVDEKKGFYDKLWKTYLTKEKITNMNKETFLTTTKLIMENRRDGQSLAWKWCQENQQIPYQEFTKFYADLSDFITSQREGYFNIEKECMTIANRNNTMLDTFPNNIYNKVLECPRIKFEYGMLSDSTNNVFAKKVENLKQ